VKGWICDPPFHFGLSISSPSIKHSLFHISLIISYSFLVYIYGLPLTGAEGYDDMAQEEGLIASIDDKGWAEVVIQRRDACGDCGGAAHCSIIFTGCSKMFVKALNRVGANKGDRVVIDLATGNVIQSAAILFVIPLLGLIFGAIIGSTLVPGWPFKGNDASMLFAFLGLALGLLVTVLISRHLSKKKQFTSVITRVLDVGAEGIDSLMAEDPICKALLDPARAPVSLDCQGKTYHFCSSSCRDTFAEHPEKFL
jgi:sigma-E factor negative regulatory protein RseC